MVSQKIPQCYASLVERISSRQNAIVSRYRAVARGDDQDLMLLDGTHLLDEALSAGTRLDHVAVTVEAHARHDVAALTARAIHAGVPLVEVTAPVMDALSPVQSASPIVALACRPPHATDWWSDADPLVLIASDIQDPGNVGAILRVAEAAGVTAAVCTGACADPFSWKAVRGSMGSALRLPVAQRPLLDTEVRTARARGVRVVATVPRDGVSLFEADLTGPLAVLIGSEGVGLPPAVLADADLRVTIPMMAPVESLNAAVAAAVLLFEVRRQRLARGPATA